MKTTYLFLLFATFVTATITGVTKTVNHVSIPFMNPSMPTDRPLTKSFMVDVTRENDRSNLRSTHTATGEQTVLASGDFTVASVSGDGQIIVAAAPGALFVYERYVLVKKIALTCVFSLCNVTNITVHNTPDLLTIAIQSGHGIAFYAGGTYSSVKLQFRQALQRVAVVTPDISLMSVYNETTMSIEFYDVFISSGLSRRSNDLKVDNPDKDVNWVTTRDGLIVGTTHETALYRYDPTVSKWDKCHVPSVSDVAAFSPDEKYIVFGNGFRLWRFLLSAGGCGHQEEAPTYNSNTPFSKLWIDNSATTAISTGYIYYKYTVYNFTLSAGSVCAETEDCPSNMACNATTFQCELMPLLVPVTTLQKSQSVYIMNNRQKFLTIHGFVNSRPSEANWKVEEQLGGVYSVSTDYHGVTNHLTTDQTYRTVDLSTIPIDVWSTFSFTANSLGKWTVRTAADDSLWTSKYSGLTADGIEGDASTFFEMAIYKTQ